MQYRCFSTLARMAILLAGMLCLPVLAESRPQAFTENTLAELEARHRGQPFVLVLWSVHCAPCFAELEMIGTALAQQPDLAVVVVATDGTAARDDVGWILEDYGLDARNTWQFAGDFAEKLRYRVDPDWYGELPRSYFYDAVGQREGHSGVISREQLLAWLGDAS